MPVCEIPEAIEDLKAGKMVILMDDESRENEGDLVIAAEHASPAAVNFMARYARGLICLAMAPEWVDRLELPPMTSRNESAFGTGFTVSIEARQGVTTGISARDRATTIQAAVADDAGPHSVVSPGHIFPLRAREGGVLVRAGQTEGSVDLARLGGMKPCAVICEIMKDDGTMARLPDLEAFGETHGIRIVTNRDLIRYRLRHDSAVISRVGESRLPTSHGGEFRILAYHSHPENATHLALVKGNISSQEPTLVRVHSECLTGDVFGSLRCDCGPQLHDAMRRVGEEGRGVVLYMRQEGRGIGLENKIRAYGLQDEGRDTVQANEDLGFPPDLRDYGVGAQILKDVGVGKIRLLTNNPRKIVGLDGYGLEVVAREPIEVGAHAENACYLCTKRERMGHLLSGADLNEQGEIA